MDNERPVRRLQETPLRPDEKLSRLACSELVSRIRTRAAANHVDHLIQPRILDMLNIGSLETALLHELKAVEGMLFVLCLYR